MCTAVTIVLLHALFVAVSSLPVPHYCLRLNLTVGVPQLNTLDSTPTIRSQLLVAAMFGGGTVYLSDGVYPVKEALVVPPNVCLRGHYGTVLRASENFTNASGDRTTMVFASNNTVVYQLGLDATNRSDHGLVVKSAQNFTAFNMSIRNTRRDALRLQDTHNTRLERVEIRHAGRDALAVSGGRNVSLAHISMQNATRHALVISSDAVGVAVRHLTVFAAQIGVAVKPTAADKPAPINVHLAHANISAVEVDGVWVKRAKHVRLVNLNITAAHTCYRVTDTVVTLIGGECQAVRRYRGEPLALPACAPGDYSMRKACCPARCGRCISTASKCTEGKDECCAPKVLEGTRKCGKVVPPCILV